MRRGLGAAGTRRATGIRRTSDRKRERICNIRSVAQALFQLARGRGQIAAAVHRRARDRARRRHREGSGVVDRATGQRMFCVVLCTIHNSGASRAA